MPLTKSEKHLYAALVGEYGHTKARAIYHAMRYRSASKYNPRLSYAHSFGLTELNRERKRLKLPKWSRNPYV